MEQRCDVAQLCTGPEIRIIIFIGILTGNYSANGCLFLAEECVPGDSDKLIIYGHHMNGGKMFADLEKYKDEGILRGTSDNPVPYDMGK